MFPNLRIGGEPKADGSGLAVVRVEFEDATIVVASEFGMAEVLGVDRCDEEIGFHVVRSLLEEFFQFVSGVLWIVGFI